MPQIKIRMELNKGRIGIPMAKLSDILKEATKFFSMLCEDAGLVADHKKWVAQDFHNGSVEYECEYVEEVTQRKADDYKAGLREVITRPERGFAPFRIRPATLRQYSYIAGSIDSDEVIRFGLAPTDTAPGQEWFTLTKKDAAAISRDLPDKVSYFGCLQGVIHTLHKEADDPHLTVREQVSGKLVACYFGQEDYDTVATLLKPRGNVIYIEGMIEENIIEDRLVSIQAEDFRVLRPFQEEDIDGFIGSCPKITGNLTTQDFLGRDQDNED